MLRNYLILIITRHITILKHCFYKTWLWLAVILICCKNWNVTWKYLVHHNTCFWCLKTRLALKDSKLKTWFYKTWHGFVWNDLRVSGVCLVRLETFYQHYQTWLGTVWTCIKPMSETPSVVFPPQSEWPHWAATMALVQALPLSAESHNQGLGGGHHRRHASGSSPPFNAPPSALDSMGSVSSLIASRPGHYQDHRSVGELGARVRRATPGAACLGSESPPDSLLQHCIEKESSMMSIRDLEKESGNGNFTYLNEDFIGDWNDNRVTCGSPGSDAYETKGSGFNGNMGGPPPKLIPVSGKLEKVSLWINTF